MNPSQKNRETGDYLWDGTGEPDPVIVEIENALRPLRLNGKRRARRRFGWRVPTAAAASIGVLLVSWLILRGSAAEGSGVVLTGIEGRPQVAGAVVRNSANIAVGEWIETDNVSSAQMSLPGVGTVAIAPESRLKVNAVKGREHHLVMNRGRIEATVWAPPRMLFVETPSARAIDMGCAYELEVGEDGTGLLRVTSGWVDLERDDAISRVVEGMVCDLWATGPGTPYKASAAAGFVNSLRAFDRGGASADLQSLLGAATSGDGLTLWHLLARVSPDNRQMVVDRLETLGLVPSGVIASSLNALEVNAMAKLWTSLRSSP